MVEPEKAQGREFEALRLELGAIFRALSGLESQLEEGQPLTDTIRSNFNEQRAKLYRAQTTVLQHLSDEDFLERYRIEPFLVDDLYKKLVDLETKFGIEQPVSSKEVVVVKDSGLAAADSERSETGGDAPETESMSWDKAAEELGRQIKSLNQAIASNKVDYEAAREWYLQCRAAWDTLEDALDDDDPLFDKRTKRLSRFSSRLRKVKDLINDLKPAETAPAAAATEKPAPNNTLKGWERDETNHPSLFREDIKNSNVEAAKLLEDAEDLIYEVGTADVKSGLTSTDSEVVRIRGELNEQRDKLYKLLGRAERQLQRLRDTDDIEADDKAELLYRRYIEGGAHLQDLLHRIDTLRQQLWQLGAVEAVPALESLRSEISVADGGEYEDPVLIGDVAAHLAEWQTDIRDLEAVLNATITAAEALTFDSDLELQRREHQFITDRLNPIRAELARRKNLAAEFSGDNIEILVPLVGDLRKALNFINTNFHKISDIEKAVRSVNTLEEGVRSAVKAAGLDSKEYEDVLEALWVDVEALNDRLERWTENRDKLSEIEEEIESGIERNLRQKLYVTSQKNPIEEAYHELMHEVHAKVPEDETELRHRLEIKILHGEFKQLRKWIDLQLTDMEWSGAGIGAMVHFYDEVKQEFFARNEAILLELQDLHDPELPAYQAEADAVSAAVTDRVMVHFSWMSTFQSILITKEGTSPERKPPPSLSSESLPLSGARIERLVKEGIAKSEIGEITNAKLGEAVAVMRSRTEHGKLEEVHYQETAFGHCMRRFDDVYEGRVPEAKASNGEAITTRNLHTTYGDLIEFVWKEEEARAGGPRFTKDVVMHAFRLHTMLTLNHSFLAEDSPTVADYLYYMFNWLDYCIKYAFDGTNRFSPLVTYLLFTYEGVKVMEELYGEKKMAAVRQQLKDKGLLRTDEEVKRIQNKQKTEPDKLTKDEQKVLDLLEATGFASFDFLADGGGLFKLTNEAQGTVRKDGKYKLRVKTPNMTPPLGWFTMKDDEGHSRRYPDSVDPVSGKRKRGRYITLNDVQDATTGRRIYEMMDFKTIGDQLIEYYNQLSKNGLGFLNGALKADTSKFLKDMESTDFVSGLKNDDKYVSTLLPNVGVMIHEGDKKGKKELGKAVMNKVITMLVLAKCLLETSYEADKPWSIQQVRDYLTRLVGQNAIREEVAQAIEISVTAGSLAAIRGRAALERFSEQLQKAASVR